MSNKDDISNGLAKPTHSRLRLPFRATGYSLGKLCPSKINRDE